MFDKIKPIYLKAGIITLSCIIGVVILKQRTPKPKISLSDIDWKKTISSVKFGGNNFKVNKLTNQIYPTGLSLYSGNYRLSVFPESNKTILATIDRLGKEVSRKTIDWNGNIIY